MTVPSHLLPTAARGKLGYLLRAALAEVYQSPYTGEWMIWQALAKRPSGQPESVRNRYASGSLNITNPNPNDRQARWPSRYS